MVGDDLPRAAVLVPGVCAHDRARAALAVVELVVAVVVSRDGGIAVRPDLEVTNHVFAGLVRFRVAHVLQRRRLRIPIAPAAAAGVILGVVLLHIGRVVGQGGLAALVGQAGEFSDGGAVTGILRNGGRDERGCNEQGGAQKYTFGSHESFSFNA